MEVKQSPPFVYLLSCPWMYLVAWYWTQLALILVIFIVPGDQHHHHHLPPHRLVVHMCKRHLRNR